MANYKSTMATSLVLCFLLIASVSESRPSTLGFTFKDSAPSGLSCATVYGAEQDDTCVSVGQKFMLSASAFLKINPNINCETIFVGQWLCISKA